MKKTELVLEDLIKAYAINAGKDGVFLSILEYSDDLATILKIAKRDLVKYVDGYMYVSNFKNEEKLREFFEKIKTEVHPDAAYVVLVINNEIIEEYPEFE